MKERPILFSTMMVQALLAGRKTQTRRTTGLEKLNENPGNWQKVTPDVYTVCNEEENDPWSYCDFQTLSTEYMACPKCPYGQVGDILWVRETFCFLADEHGYTHWDQYRYRADDPDIRLVDPDGFHVYRKDGTEGSPWKPSIHMPKNATRIWLEITDIRVERAQEISEADAQAEGIVEVTKDGKLMKYCVYDHKDYSSTPWQDMPRSAKEAFGDLWTKINGAESWQANPFCWVVSFKVLSTTGRPGQSPDQ